MDALCDRLYSQYDVVLQHVPLYSSRRRCIAEIDVLAVTGNYCDIYEVKCSHRLTKARRQLVKIKKILSRDSIVRDSFFYCGGSRLLVKL